MEAKLREIFRSEFEGYRKRHGLKMDQHKAAQAIMDCQSEELGHEEWACPNGDHVERQNHSCRHRSCPRCHGAQSHAWVEKIKERLLPCDHFHVVFTLPHELNPIWQYNRRWFTDRLFKATSETLRELLADERYLGAEVGMISSLHTWSRTLSEHPHMHILVTGGGLCEGEYRGLKRDFLLPVGVLKAKFRGKWLSWLNRAYDTGELNLPSRWAEPDWRKVLRRVAKKPWNVRIQGAYRHGQGVAIYLSSYVRGGPIKDSQLLQADSSTIRFRYRDHQRAQSNVMALPTEQFITRVLWHVPVRGQHNVRYYGLYVPGARAKRDLLRQSLGQEAERNAPAPTSQQRRCPNCGLLLFHRSSTRRRISYIRSAPVQPNVQVDRESAVPHRGNRTTDPPLFFFGRAAATY